VIVLLLLVELAGTLAHSNAALPASFVVPHRVNAQLMPIVSTVSRIGRHPTAKRGGENSIHQSGARVVSVCERDYASIKNPSRRHLSSIDINPVVNLDAVLLRLSSLDNKLLHLQPFCEI
jgi:hypothetical protein